jgi:hypothetical protein
MPSFRDTLLSNGKNQMIDLSFLEECARQAGRHDNSSDLIHFHSHSGPKNVFDFDDSISSVG